jgi:hypothetical protein
LSKRVAVRNCGFIHVRFAGFLGRGPDELVHVRKVVIRFSDSDISYVYVWTSVQSRDIVEGEGDFVGRRSVGD